MRRIVLFALCLGSVALAQGPISPITDEIPEATAKAIDAGLKFLADNQNADGSWTDGVGRRINYDYHVHYTGPNVGVTALALIAFLANGSTPGRGPFGEEADRALDWLIEHQTSGGFITWQSSRMYSHAFATLAMAEVYGMTEDSRLEDPLRAAVNRIVVGQNEQGGWRYLPGSVDSDISVTVCQILALRAARNAGIEVPWSTLKLAVDYVRRSYVDAPRSSDHGGFYYQVDENRPRRPTRVTFPLTAAGVVCLYGAGEYDTSELLGGLRYLEAHRPPRNDMHTSFDYFYGHYYAIQAFYQAGGTHWNRWWPSVRDEIVAGQRRGGFWQDQVGANYATAMATIILQIPYRYLPIFER